MKPGEPLDPDRTRRPGGGRKPTTDKDPKLLADLDALVELTASGDPDSPLRWVLRSERNLAAALRAMGHAVSHTVVAELLQRSVTVCRQNRSGVKERSTTIPTRSFVISINDLVRRFHRRNQPVISVDTKIKELIGDFRNAGREWRPKGDAEVVRVHDFVIPAKGKAIPYGVYDPHRNEGWVSIGVDHDTASSAVNAIRRWWKVMGRAAYPNATSLLITADAGGSNGPHVRLWKWELQQFANRTGLTITVCHVPPGTSKWNRIEHRLFSHIAMNWRGKPLVSLAAVVSLIAATRTTTGLRVRSEIDRRHYPRGRRRHRGSDEAAAASSA